MAPGSALPPLLRAFLVLGIVLMAVAALRTGAPLLVPVVEALVVCFVLNGVATAIRRVPGLGPLVPRWAALLLAALVALGLGAWAAQSTLRAGAAMGPQAAAMRDAFGPVVEWVAGVLGITGPEVISRGLDALGLEAALRYVVAATVATISHFGVVAIYVGFLLVDQQFLDRKLRALIPDPARREQVNGLIDRIAASIQTYLWIMTFVSALTAALCYVVMRTAGLELAGFWAIAIFFLNFIPTIGSILGTVLPGLVALLQLQSPLDAALVLAAVGLIQFVIGNILLPRLAGGTLNISLFVTIFSLFFFGAIWGVTGMFVAMPLTAIIVIAFSHFEATRPIAILLSRTGSLDAPR